MHRPRFTRFSECVVEEPDWPAPVVNMGLMFRCPRLSCMSVLILLAIYDSLKKLGPTCNIYLNVYFVLAVFIHCHANKARLELTRLEAREQETKTRRERD